MLVLKMLKAEFSKEMGSICQCQNCRTLLKSLSWHNIALQSSSEYSAGGGGQFVLSGMWSFILLPSWGNKKLIEHFVETGLGVKQKQFPWCMSKIYFEKKFCQVNKSTSFQSIFSQLNWILKWREIWNDISSVVNSIHTPWIWNVIKM